MRTVDEEPSVPLSSDSDNVDSLVRAGHSRKQSKTTQQKREASQTKKISLIRKQTIAMRKSVFAEAMIEPDKDQPPAEGVMLNE